MSGTGLVVALAIASAALLAGCGDATKEAAPRSASTTTIRSGDEFGSLCAALDAADAGDIETARQAFDHGPLHDLADAAIDLDRAVAARLLVAKEAVESALADSTTPPSEVAHALRTLAGATAAALTATGVSTRALCEQETP